MSEKSVSEPHQLPTGWSWSTFSTVATIASNLVPPNEWAEKPHIAPDNIERDTGRLLPFRTIAEDAVTSPKHFFKPGQLLYSKIRPYLNKCVRISFPGLCSADMYPLDAHIEPGYLHSYILSPQFVSAVTEAAGSRTVLPKTNQEQLSKVPIPVAPKPEQYKISEALESYFSRLDDAVATLERVKRNLKRYRASVLKSAVEGRLVPTEAALARQEGRDYEPASVLLERILTERHRWNESAKKGTYEGYGPPHMNNLPELPEGWCWATAETVCEQVVDCHNKTAPYVEAGIPLLRTTNIRKGVLKFDELRYVTDETYAHWSRRCPPLPGDVLFTREAPMGEAAIVPAGMKVCMGQRMMLLRADPRLLLPQYLLLSLQVPHILQYATRRAVGIGVQHLRVRDVETLPIPLAPLQEQRRIVEESERQLTVIEALAQVQIANERRCRRLRQSILKWAFEGKLADQDPNDEPASVFLERIRAERTTPQAAKKKGRV